MQIYFSEEYDFMSKYYNYVHLKDLFNENIVLKETSNVVNPIYYDVITMIRKCKDLPMFPLLKSRAIYQKLLPSSKPAVENRYPLYNWPLIWENINLKFVSATDREIIYKYLHEILPNKKRLKDMRITMDPNFEICNVEDSNIHMVYFCKKVENSIPWLKRLLEYFCDFQNCILLRIMYFDFPVASKKRRNTATMILTSFLVNVWILKGSNVPECLIKNKVKAMILKNQRYVKLILKNKMYKFFTKQYCELNQNLL